MDTYSLEHDVPCVTSFPLVRQCHSAVSAPDARRQANVETRTPSVETEYVSARQLSSKRMESVVSRTSNNIYLL